MDVCTCLLTAVLAGSNFPDVVGGIKAQGGCRAGTFSYTGHDLVSHDGPNGKQTHIHVLFHRHRSTRYPVIGIHLSAVKGLQAPFMTWVSSQPKPNPSFYNRTSKGVLECNLRG